MAIYMRIPGINGDVTLQGYNKWIAISSIDFGVHRKIQTQPGRNHDRVTSSTFGTEMLISKLIDKTSPQFFNQATVGSALEEVKIDFCHTIDALSPYLEYTLSNVIIGKYGIYADRRANNPVEWLSLNYTAIETRFTPHDAKHQIGSPIATRSTIGSASAKQLQQLKLCPPIPIAPPGVDIKKNIALALKHKYNMLWLYFHVRNHAIWDYKQRGHQYEAFGNFHYGAIGRAMGFPAEYLLCMAGWAQQDSGTSDKEWGGTPGFYCLYGGKASYGDDPKDQAYIKAGMRYFDNGCYQDN